MRQAIRIGPLLVLAAMTAIAACTSPATINGDPVRFADDTASARAVESIRAQPQSLGPLSYRFPVIGW